MDVARGLVLDARSMMSEVFIHQLALPCPLWPPIKVESLQIIPSSNS